MDICVLSNFSVLKSFTDNAQNTLDSLMPFVEYGLSILGTEYMEFDTLQKRISTDCYLDIPSNTLKTLLKRFKRNGVITDFEGWSQIQIVDRKKIDSNHYKLELTKSQRNINQFIHDFRNFSKVVDDDDNRIIQQINEFISTYQEQIDISEDRIEIQQIKTEGNNSKIYEFITYISKYNDASYQVFKSIFHGFLLKQFIAHREYTENRNIKNLLVYADTNFILRLLDLQAPPFVNASKELMILMQECHIKIITFAEVIDEVRAVINSNLTRYIREKDELLYLYGSSTKQIDGIMGSFFRRSMDITSINCLCDEIEEILKNEGIEVLKTPINPGIRISEREYQKILEYKIEKHHISIDDLDYDYKMSYIERKALLDAKMLQYIRQKRNGRKFRFENCEHVLLTCDNIVYKVNKHFHNDQHSVPECLNEIRLTNTLFMNNPKLDIDASIRFLSSVFQLSSFIDIDLLKDFHGNLKEYTIKHPNEQQYLGYIFNNQSLFDEIYLADNMETDIEDDILMKKLFEDAKKAKLAEEIKSETELKRLQKENEELAKKLEEIIIQEKNEPIPQSKTRLKENENFETIDSKSITIVLKVGIGIIVALFLSIFLLIAIPNFNLAGLLDSPAIALSNLVWWIIPVCIIILIVKIYTKGRINKIVKFILGDRTFSLRRIFGRMFLEILLWVLGIVVVGIIVGIFSNTFFAFLTN